MPLVVAPTLQNVYEPLGDFVTAVVPANVVVVQGLPNGVSMPPADPGFVCMTAVLMDRLRTNVDTYADSGDPGPDQGTVSPEQGVKLTIQLDCYGALSADWAAMLTTLLRSEYGCDALATVGSVLYADDAKMAPLIDSERDYEQRWIVSAVLQYNPVTSTPMQFADSLDVELIETDERYPP